MIGEFIGSDCALGLTNSIFPFCRFACYLYICFRLLIQIFDILYCIIVKSDEENEIQINLSLQQRRLRQEQQQQLQNNNNNNNNNNVNNNQIEEK